MGFRFQRRIKLFPGVSINVSKAGLSASVGPKGAKVTAGHGRLRKTVGLPGTGLSHSSVSRSRPTVAPLRLSAGGAVVIAVAIIALIVWLL